MTRPRAGIPREAPELEMLAAFLDWLRESMVHKVEGLSEEDARRKLVPSSTTPIGLLKHLAYVERWWFQHHFAGRDVELGPEDDSDFVAERDETLDRIIGFYRSECNESRAVIAGASPEDHAKSADRSDHTLRWIMVHMIEETARHAGHADILREQIDGSTGE
ncbi:MAG: DinB family protein [Actinomycetota bacterium]